MVLLLILLNVVSISFSLWAVCSFSRRSAEHLKRLDENFAIFLNFYLTNKRD